MILFQAWSKYVSQRTLTMFVGVMAPRCQHAENSQYKHDTVYNGVPQLPQT